MPSCISCGNFFVRRFTLSPPNNSQDYCLRCFPVDDVSTEEFDAEDTTEQPDYNESAESSR